MQKSDPERYAYDGIDKFHEGLARVTMNDNTIAYIDTLGHFISPVAYEEGTEFRGGLARVGSNGEIYYINHKGEAFITEKEILIGKQRLAFKDLDVRTFANGDSIPIATYVWDFAKMGKDKKPGCYSVKYTHDGKTRKAMIYNWYAVKDARKLAPAGWVIPTFQEWDQLVKAACDSIACDVLYALGFKNGGFGIIDGNLGSINPGSWWTKSPLATSEDLSLAMMLITSLGNMKGVVTSAAFAKESGWAVRCIRPVVAGSPASKGSTMTVNCDSLRNVTLKSTVKTGLMQIIQ